MGDLMFAATPSAGREPVFGDAVEMLRNALIGELQQRFNISVPISSRRPSRLPPEFVRLMLVGGARKNIITVSRTFAIEAWASSSTRAVQLVEAAYAVTHSLENSVIDGVQVGMVQDFALPADLPDPDTEHFRFTFTTSIDLSYTDTI